MEIHYVHGVYFDDNFHEAIKKITQSKPSGYFSHKQNMKCLKTIYTTSRYSNTEGLAA
jgi:hypothetical protein